MFRLKGAVRRLPLYPKDPELRRIGGRINLRGRRWFQITDDEIVQLACSRELRKQLDKRTRQDLWDIVEHRELQEYIEEHRKL